MLKRYIQRLIKQKGVKADELNRPSSAYKIIRAQVKNSNLALFYLTAYYEYQVSLEAIQCSYRLYIELTKHNNFKINLAQFRPYSFRDFWEAIEDAYNNTLGVPNVTLNEIEEFKNILHDSNYVVIACLRLADGDYRDDFATMKYFGSSRWCIKRRDQFLNYATSKNSIQYILIRKSIFENFKEQRKLGRLIKESFSFDDRIGITLKRDKTLIGKRGFFRFFKINEKIICHDENNHDIPKMLKFNLVTDSFPIDKVHNKLIKIIKKKKILDLSNIETKPFEDPYEFYPSQYQREYDGRRGRIYKF